MQMNSLDVTWPFIKFISYSPAVHYNIGNGIRMKRATNNALYIICR